jgi:5-hydroxyisourate hydrolase
MSKITTHVLDTARGRPAAGVAITLEFENNGGWELVGSGITDAQGRVKEFFSPGFEMRPGVYRITFDTASYFAALGTEGFYREVTVVFSINDADQHYHVPLLLSPFGYSTYRGS